MRQTKCEKAANLLLSREYFSDSIGRAHFLLAPHFHSHSANYFFDASDRIFSRKSLNAAGTNARRMRDYTPKEKAKITAGAVTALVIVAWLAIIALALLSGG